MWIQSYNNINVFACKTITYNLICVYTCLSGKLNGSSLRDRRSWTRHATTRIRNNSESAALDEYNDVKIVMHLHVKRILIIWFVCIHHSAVNCMNRTKQTTDHEPDMLQVASNMISNQ